MPDCGRKTRPWSYARLWLYARLRSKDLTSVGRCDSDHMPDSSRKTWLWSYAWLQSYARLWSKYPTQVRRRNSDWKTRLWLKGVTPVVCLTPIGKYDFGHISWLRSQFPTLVNITTLIVSPKLRSHNTAPVEEHIACLTNSSIKDYAWSS
jgi:hypothetical protein